MRHVARVDVLAHHALNARDAAQAGVEQLDVDRPIFGGALRRVVHVGHLAEHLKLEAALDVAKLRDAADGGVAQVIVEAMAAILGGSQNL